MTALVLVSSFSDAHALMGNADSPETLDAHRASQLGPLAPGTRLSIVHEDGLVQPEIVAVHCHAPQGEDDPGMARMKLSRSVPTPERTLGLRRESNLMVAGVRVAPDVGLRLPPAKTEVSVAVRNALLALAVEQTQSIADRCAEESDSGEPPPPLTIASLEALQLLAVGGRDGTWSFATYDVTSCEEPIRFGVLLDPKGRVVKHWETNNDVVVLWIADLDGGGDEEFGLQVTWLEDGMEEISIEYRHDGTWRRRMMYVSESP